LLINILNIIKKKYDKKIKPTSHINIGNGRELTIKELAETIKEVVGHKWQISFNPNKPDDSPRKLLDSGRLNSLDWKSKINLKEGLIKTYKDYIKS